MKKSDAYWLAQMAVIGSPDINKEDKLKVLKVLQHDEELARFVEQQEETEDVEV